jgi:DNA-binding response OmpR family regulator/Tfp pilus assembly protein PilF
MPALDAALARHRVFVEPTTIDAVVDSVLVAAPDLVLLLGEAAKDCGSEVLTRLNASPQSSVVPVVILDDNTALDARLRAFRHGATAVIQRSASVDAIAQQIASLAREIPDRGTSNLGVVGEATLEEFVRTLGNELRTGILTVKPAGRAEFEPIRLVLGSGKPLAEFVDDFVARVRKHVVHAEPLRYEFDERAGGTLQLLDGEVAAAEPEIIQNLRVALADDDTTRADAVAQELRAHGASVVVTDLVPSELRFHRVRQADPSVLLIGEEQLKGHGYDLVRRMREDIRLRWASLLVVRWDKVWSEEAQVPAAEKLAAPLAALSEPERTLLGRAADGTPFDTRLEIMGPARLLRTLARTSHPLRVSVQNPRACVSVDLSDGLVVGATASVSGQEARELQGPIALAAFLVLSSGRVHVERVTLAAEANVMATVEVALNVADAEPPPIVPSQPTRSPARASRRPMSQKRGARRSAGISRKLALVLVSLAVAQGLLLVGLYALFRSLAPASAGELPEAAIAVRPEPKQAAPAMQTAKAPPEPAASTPAPVRPVAPSPAAGTPEPTKHPTQKVVRAVGKPPFLDGSGSTAPSCEALAQHATAPKTKHMTVDQLLRHGHKELVRGDFDAAQYAFCRALATDKENLGIALTLTQLLLLRRDGAAAAEAARRALEMDPASTRALSLLGDALVRTGDIERAKHTLLRAARLEDDAASAVARMLTQDLHEADQAFRKNDYARSERFYRRVLAFRPESLTATLGLGSSLLRQADTVPARLWAERAIELDDKSGAARLLYGDVLERAGERERALVEWRAALALEPMNAAAKTRLHRAERAR